MFFCFWRPPSILLAPLTGFSAEWAKDMFKETTYDFGVVARGAKAEHGFTFENIYLEDAHIATVRSSCGCTSTQFPEKDIKTYEKADIVAKLDTRSFLGRKDATLTVIFDKPFAAEVALHVHCYIRSDVVFQPGVVQFGSVRRGQSVQRKTGISYAGRDDWKIESVTCSNPSIKTNLVEASRFQGRVDYELWLTLADDAEPGYIKDQVILHTNDADPSKSHIPLSVEGVITDALTVRPAPLTFGILSPGQSVTKNLVIRGHAPFRVTRIACDNSNLAFETPSETKTFHIIPVTLRCPVQPGKIKDTITIQTDIPDTPASRVCVYGEVSAADMCEKSEISK